MTLKNMQSWLNALLITGGQSSKATTAYTSQYRGVVSLKDLVGGSIGNLGSGSGSDGGYVPFNDFSTTLVTAESASHISRFYYHLGFGNGTTEVTEDDYKLASLITSGLEIASHTQTITASKSSSYYTRKIALQVVVQNTSAENITITEVGFFQDFCYGSSSYRTIMIHRELLETPVILEPSASVTMDFNFEITNSIAS